MALGRTALGAQRLRWPPTPPAPKKPSRVKRNVGFGCLGALGLVVLIGIVSAAASGSGSSSKSTASTSPKPAATTPATAAPAAPAATPKPATPAPPPKNDGKMTMAEFNQIQPGMTMEQVVQIVGGPGTLRSQNQIADITTSSYDWQGDKVFSSASLMFQNGQVFSKTQFGLDS